MTKAVVLGAGMVGSVMAADLAGDSAFSVTVADASAENPVPRASAEIRAFAYWRA